ncbi:hypothetical protein GCM10022403_080480 [Streptomyces coacervatus]|uniref:Uncharacterized protein n=1 Tax=Streptomyces coacervatus TaxID=647381 RepID=A0ABP7J5Z4_9ACTN|nr:hypothetical protein [Streptomyces coacervatus]MDF2269426.1 hypothetical protein [Streptomyces coacervatus]
MSTTTPTNGFIVTIEQTATIQATALREGDTFTLVGNDSPLTILARRRHLQPLWLLTLEGQDAPITLRDDEPIQPLRMLRTFDLTCQLCGRTARHVLDLPVHGIPQAWVCGRPCPDQAAHYTPPAPRTHDHALDRPHHTSRHRQRHRSHQQHNHARRHRHQARRHRRPRPPHHHRHGRRRPR